ncbi:MAG: SDR family NAD(P)-dependent oxidoreductase [Alphaproteobacteria bacterium]|nr:SDR family NAD(P)-dependent oxidoreductase [Alphaproteobacteria bacterium]
MDNAQSLAGRVAVITGASRGIGRAIATRFASAGAHVILAARSVEKPTEGFPGTVHDVAEAIRAFGGTATPLALDVADEASRVAFVEACREQVGTVDILVNNAGTPLYKTIDAYSYADIRNQIGMYYEGPLHLINMLVPGMKAKRAGWILNLGSSSVVKLPKQPYAQHLAYFGIDALYASLKAADHRMSFGLAAELYEHGIAVNIVAPVRAVWTPGLEHLGLEFGPDHPAIEKEEHIAEAALALVSEPLEVRTGVLAWSCQFLDEIRRTTMSLDGRSVIEERTPVAAEA